MASPITTQGWILRLGGAAAALGSLMAMVGNLLHPMTPVGDPAGVGHAIHGSQGWTIIHLVIVLGLINDRLHRAGHPGGSPSWAWCSHRSDGVPSATPA